MQISKLSRMQLCKEVTLRDPEDTQKQLLHSGQFKNPKCFRNFKFWLVILDFDI